MGIHRLEGTTDVESKIPITIHQVLYPIPLHGEAIGHLLHRLTSIQPHL
jgi:hypothetical protein